MANLMTSLMIGGILAVIAVVVVQSILTAQTTTTWDTTTATLFPLIGVAVTVVGVIAGFLLIKGRG